MNKRAIIEQPMHWAVSLAFLAVIIIVFFAVQFAFKDNTAHFMESQARDYAFTRDAVSLSQGNIYFVYKVEPNITLSTNPNCIIETKSTKNSLLSVKYPCSRSNVNIQEFIEKNKIILKNEK